MPTVKVKRGGEFYCFFCNARVDESAERCAECGREFTSARARGRSQAEERTLGERIRIRAGGRQGGYWRVVVMLAVLGVAVLLLWPPGRVVRPLLPQPTLPRPAYRIVETRDMPADRVDRLTVVAAVRPGMERDSLRAALDWVLFSTLDEYNRQKRRFARVIWAYLLEDPALPVSRWRAMAIWTDPALPESRRPAGPGGDAVEAGPVEYDFTNPLSATGGK